MAPSFGDAASRAPAGASPAEITALGHDPEARLRRAVDASRGGDWAHLLGSNQTAFVLFLLLGSEPALAHWKATTALMCDAAVSCAAAHAQLYEAFTASFAAQLDRAAETLFEDEDLSEFSAFSGDVARKGGHNFLRAALVALTGGLREALDGHEQHEAHEEPAVVETRRRGRLLEKWALAKFGVDVAAERADAVKKQNESGAFPFDPADEDAPAVAELAEGTYARMDDAGEDADAPATDAGDEQGARRMGWMVQ